MDTTRRARTAMIAAGVLLAALTASTTTVATAEPPPPADPTATAVTAGIEMPVPAAPAAVTTITAGTGYAPDGGAMVLPTTDEPVAPPATLADSPRPAEPAVAIAEGAPAVAAAPSIPPTQAARDGGASDEAGAAAPNDFRIFRNTTLDLAANQTSTTDEPSVAHVGNTVFMTGNWWSAISRDGGESFTHVNPFTAFGGGYGGFCCDQVTIYSPVGDATVWVLQYNQDGAGNNAERVAVSVGEPNLRAMSFFFADVTPQQLGQPNGVWADFPHVAVNAGFFWLTFNMFNSSGGYVGTAVIRVPWADLVNGGGFGFNFFTTTLGTVVPTAGAGSTMYLGTHLDTDTLRIWTWPDNTNTLGQHDVNHSAYNTGAYTCTTNDGFNPCGRSDGRVRGGWVGNGIIGFSWDAAQGSQALGNFPFPYTFVARISEATFGLVDQPILWNAGHAWFYGGIGANGRGHVGMSVDIAGGATFPGSQIVIADDIGGPWQGGFFVAASSNTPASNRWGDYNTTRAVNGTGLAWAGASYVLVGACAGGGVDCDNVRVHYTVFGRERDWLNCPDDGFEPDDSSGQSLLLAPTTTSAGHAFCSTSDQDWFRFSGVAGNQYRIETLNLAGGNDTVLTLYNSALTQLAIDDDGGSEFRSSRIDFVTPSSGTYYVKATRFNGLRSFGYRYDLRITRDTPPVVTRPTTSVRANTTLGLIGTNFDVAVRDQWTRSDPEGIASQDLEECRNAGCAFANVAPAVTAAATTYDHRLPGRTQMQRRIRATDTLGAFSPFATGNAFTVRGVQQTHRTWDYAGTWTRLSSPAFYGGSVATTTGGIGTGATIRFTGRSIGLIGARRTTGGRASIFLDGTFHGIAEYFAGSAQNRRILFAIGGLPPTRPNGSPHVLEVRWRRDANPASNGRRMFLDGIALLQ